MSHPIGSGVPTELNRFKLSFDSIYPKYKRQHSSSLHSDRVDDQTKPFFLMSSTLARSDSTRRVVFPQALFLYTSTFPR